MRLSDFRGKRVKDLDGEKLGVVHEVHCERGRIVALMTGPGSLVERWTAKGKGRRIAWESVCKVGADEIVVAPGAPKRGVSGASRSRQGTRRPTGPRSTR
jgi:sporulation protein YlmC with PRC-barrel domain